MKILVTGGAGFIGSHIIDQLLAKGEHVVCVDNFSSGNKKHLKTSQENQNFRLYHSDLFDLSKLKAIFDEECFDIVYHFAANSDIQAGYNNTETDLHNTFMTTFNTLSCMKEFGVKEIIFASSSAIYGELDQVLSENAGPLFPISNYGAAKLSSEAYIAAFCLNYNMKSWLVRFPNVVGWRLTHGVIYDFINKLEKDQSKLLVLGDGKQQKPYLFISDLLMAIDRIYNGSDDAINYYNVAANSTTTVKEIVDIVLHHLGLKETKVIYSGHDRGWVGDVPKFSYDTSKVNNLGWQPIMTSNEAVSMSVMKELHYRKENK